MQMTIVNSSNQENEILPECIDWLTNGSVFSETSTLRLPCPRSDMVSALIADSVGV